MKLKLKTTVAQQDALHLAHDACRENTATVKVDRAALLHLLQDHANLCHRVGMDHIEVPT